MDNSKLLRLNEILRQASEQHSIMKYDDCRDWFEGDNKTVEAQVAEVTTLFNEALSSGYITQWAEPGETGWYWDWTGDAIRKFKELGVAMADPLSTTRLFAEIPNSVTTPIEMLCAISIDDLDEDLCQRINRVYEEQVRYVVSYKGKSVAAIVPLVDLEMLKDIQWETDPCKWLEWIQNLRQRLGWPAVTFNEKEE